ncbi:ComF family protein [bacterium]|nr:ComF family protein [bacterium]
MGHKWAFCLLTGLLDAIFPPVCVLCGSRLSSGGITACKDCWAKAGEIVGPLCNKCGTPILSQDGGGCDFTYLCGICRQREWHFDIARAAYIFDGPVKDAIHLMKYQGHFLMGRWLGNKMAQIIAEEDYYKKKDKTHCMIIPVPLSPERLRQREFNQSAILASSVGRVLDLPVYSGLLERLNGDRPQVGLTTKERWSNVRGRFLVSSPERVINKRIILVDDVITTGATVNECARTLKQKGASAVDVWTLARAAQRFSL